MLSSLRILLPDRPNEAKLQLVGHSLVPGLPDEGHGGHGVHFRQPLPNGYGR